MGTMKVGELKAVEAVVVLTNEVVADFFAESRSGCEFWCWVHMSWCRLGL